MLSVPLATPRWLAPPDTGPAKYYSGSVAFEGKLFGRMLPGFSVPAVEEGKWT